MEKKEIVVWILLIFVFVNLIILNVAIFVGFKAVPLIQEGTLEGLSGLALAFTRNIDSCDADSDCEILFDKKSISCDGELTLEAKEFAITYPVCNNHVCGCDIEIK
jgi:hypothetical protein